MSAVWEGFTVSGGNYRCCHNFFPLEKLPSSNYSHLCAHGLTFDTLMKPASTYVTVLRKNGLITGLVKIDFFPEMASTKLRYCLSKI